MDIKHILVAVDYSDCSRAALVFAAGLAADLGARLDVVHVWDKPSYVANTPTASAAARAGITSLTELIREAAERDMEGFMSGVALNPDVPVSRRLIGGEPAAKLLRELEPRQHDLVVVGTHGRTGLSHLVLGSIAEKLVRLAPIPVLTVPRPS
jgi:nucleotide-binding universal stress UspA family protein